jgi:hypothetical protein
MVSEKIFQAAELLKQIAAEQLKFEEDCYTQIGELQAKQHQQKEIFQQMQNLFQQLGEI